MTAPALELPAPGALQRRMRRWVFALSLVAAAVAAAGDGDPLETPACRQAMAALQEATAAMPERRPGEAQRQPDLSAWQALRQRAARACLGSGEDPAPGRSAQPPAAVPPLVIRPPPPARPLATLPDRSAKPPLPAPPPRTVTGCDAVACWTSDGTRLQRVGPNLLGPQGLCSVHGAFLQCP